MGTVKSILIMSPCIKDDKYIQIREVIKDYLTLVHIYNGNI